MNKCPKCGFESDSKFCSQCGTEMTVFPVTDNAPEVDATEPSVSEPSVVNEAAPSNQVNEVPENQVNEVPQNNEIPQNNEMPQGQIYEPAGYERIDEPGQVSGNVSGGGGYGNFGYTNANANNTNNAGANNTNVNNAGAGNTNNTGASAGNVNHNANNAQYNNNQNDQFAAAPGPNGGQYNQGYQNNQNGQYGYNQNMASQYGYNQYNGQQKPKKRIIERGWFIILALLIFWPLGLALMWAVKKDWNIVVKIIITVLIAASVGFSVWNIFNTTSTLNYNDPGTIEYTTEATTESSTDSSEMTKEYALERAESYLNTLSFSRAGLIDQLEYEGFSTTNATWAVDNVDVDWNEEAAQMAESFLNLDEDMTYDEMVDMLLYSDFTSEQAEYGAKACGLK